MHRRDLLRGLFPFRREAREWKLALSGTFSELGVVLAKTAEELGMTENEFVLWVLEQTSGEEPDESIWLPLR